MSLLNHFVKVEKEAYESLFESELGKIKNEMSMENFPASDENFPFLSLVARKFPDIFANAQWNYLFSFATVRTQTHRSIIIIFALSEENK